MTQAITETATRMEPAMAARCSPMNRRGGPRRGGLARFACVALLAVASAGAHCEPQCFTDIGPRPTLRVTVAEPVRSDGGEPSCAGLDGIASGAVLTLHLTRRGDGDCGSYGEYRVQQIDGTTDVMLDAAATSHHLSALVFAAADGAFSSSQSAGCGGDWSLDVSPGMNSGGPISPLDKTQEWFLTRAMTITQAQSYDNVIANEGAIVYKNTFAITGITEETP